ncbi:hypothetical protein MKZ38_002615 [Zalerion maritima]|uniref:Pre-mRNA-splicing factor 18 n=1 Tax=Zalerion maritima TaxID=339359 RepID=A0AAD5RYM3_9PEZI|nr:hypothetical protein MKZ38_002615 [Zalerion maritima]
MDFASLMSSQIAKSKSTSSSTSNDKKKFAKRADAEKEREAAYFAEQKRIKEEGEAKRAAKRKREEEAAEEARVREEKRRRLAEESRARREERERQAEQERRKRLGLPELDDSVQGGSQEPGGGMDDIKDEELIAKLRELGEPAIVFGETHRARLRRYKRLTTKVTDGPIPTTLQLVEEKNMKVDGTVSKDKEGRKYLFRQLASYFDMILREWDIALQKERRDTADSKNAYRNMVQSRENMKPLFRKFEKGDLDESILQPVVEIVKAAQEKRYVDATDGFLRLSIGKAAWPIGVTMVGIHERSAREKLHNGERGHVMGDEVTRKYLQSIKRCLTFAQVRWPPEDIGQLMG